MTIEGKEITLVNLYGPNEDRPQSYENLKQKIDEFETKQVIICGDWNFILDTEMDSFTFLHVNNPRARRFVLNLIDDDNFKDPWRIMNENLRTYTWRRNNPTPKQARLVFFLVHDSIFQYVTAANIISGNRTDHSAITLKLKLHENERGRGYWKFNNSLLKDKKFVEETKQVIDEVKRIYAANIEPGENIPNQDIIFNINDQLFLETLFMMIRGNTTKYSSIRKKNNLKEENTLENDISKLESEINENFANIDVDKLEILSQKKAALIELRKSKIEGVMLRSKCRYQDLGEKPTKCFFNLENRQYTNKVMGKLIDKNGTEYTTTTEILNHQKQFYENLYDDKHNIDNRSINDMMGENRNKHTNQAAEQLEGEISYSELLNALKI